VRKRQWATLAVIAVIFGFAVYVSLPGTPGLPGEIAGRDLSDLRFRQGLDLQGGLHVRFQASPPPDQQLQDGDMDAVKQIIENRVNALGVAEPLIQIEGDNRLIVELPGVDDPEDAIRVFRQTGQLLVINTGFEFIDEGTILPADPSQTVLRGRDLRVVRPRLDPALSPAGRTNRYDIAVSVPSWWSRSRSTIIVPGTGNDTVGACGTKATAGAHGKPKTNRLLPLLGRSSGVRSRKRP